MTDARPSKRTVWVPRLGAVILRLLAHTWRLRTVEDPAYRARRNASLPVIYCVWHGNLLAPLFTNRKRGVVALISEHADGELVARLSISLGYGTVRGSTSRGAARALIGVERALRAGRSVAMTPDGPRGPLHSISPGSLVAAHRASVPIVPVGVHASSAWRLRSWDRFLIPKPMSRVTIVYGAPQMVQAGTARDAGESTEWLAGLMDAAQDHASPS